MIKIVKGMTFCSFCKEIEIMRIEIYCGKSTSILVGTK